MDTALKQRLVGASVLIALAVVVLPMLLGGRPDGDVQETQKIELPSQPPELDFETRRYPIGENAPARNPKIEPPPAKALPTPGQASGVINRSAQEESPGDSPEDIPPEEIPPEEIPPRKSRRAATGPNRTPRKSRRIRRRMERRQKW